MVVSEKADHCEAINTAIRDSGHAAHCHPISATADLAAAIDQFSPELVVLFSTDEDVDLERAGRHCNTDPVHIPMLLVSNRSCSDLKH